MEVQLLAFEAPTCSLAPVPCAAPPQASPRPLHTNQPSGPSSSASPNTQGGGALNAPLASDPLRP